jgi:putative tricarboxylic transport membrane protein
MEVNLRRAMTISNGDWSTLVASPLSISIWTLAVAGFVLPIIAGKYLRRAKPTVPEVAETEAD